MTTLKEETIKGIEAEGAFNMGNFGDYQEILEDNRRSKNFCGTACCIAGHIVAAARRLGRDVPTAKEIEKLEDQFDDCETIPEKYTHPVHGFEGGLPAVARSLWARAYGRDSANRLDFYGHSREMRNDCSYSLSDVRPEQAIAHLRNV